MDGFQLAQRLREGDLTVAPAVLNLVENHSLQAQVEVGNLLTELSPAKLGSEAKAHIVGITGPPGAGKSSLLSELVATWRKAGRSVAVLAVDPSSKRSGGSLLGDRARINFDPHDSAVLIRSTAAGKQLGGLASSTRTAIGALAVAFDVVVVETVGVGQSETEISDAADTVVVVVQPGSGDTLQFLKAGIMEIPDLLVVTKADLKQLAMAAMRDLHASLRALGSNKTEVIAVSSISPATGFDRLAEALEAHRLRVDIKQRRIHSRRSLALSNFVKEWGQHGLRQLGGQRMAWQILSQLPVDLDSHSIEKRLASSLKSN